MRKKINRENLNIASTTLCILMLLINVILYESIKVTANINSKLS
jgi:hypothetical protein